MSTDTFVANSFALRVHAGPRALEALPAELARAGVARPLLLCGPTVARESGLPERLRSLPGLSDLPVEDGLGKEASITPVQEAARHARELGCDGLIALGAGSVLRAARVVAILMAEHAPLAQLVTRYPEHGPAVGARLHAPKVPVFNVPTVASSAQHRAGSAIPHDDPARTDRLEFFDPKTRPRALFWDPEALATAPHSLVRDAATTVWWRALMSVAVVDRVNPLARADRLQAWRLADASLVVCEGAREQARRMDLCAAALLQNRDEDDGGRPMQAHRTARMVYALGAAVFSMYRQVSQAAAYAALTAAAVRLTGRPGTFPVEAQAQEAEAHSGLARALGLEAAAAPNQLADELARRLAAQGQPVRLRELGVDMARFPALARFATRSFNADASREFADREALFLSLLEAAW